MVIKMQQVQDKAKVEFGTNALHPSGKAKWESPPNLLWAEISTCDRKCMNIQLAFREVHLEDMSIAMLLTLCMLSTADSGKGIVDVLH